MGRKSAQLFCIGCCNLGGSRLKESHAAVREPGVVPKGCYFPAFSLHFPILFLSFPLPAITFPAFSQYFPAIPSHFLHFHGIFSLFSQTFPPFAAIAFSHIFHLFSSPYHHISCTFRIFSTISMTSSCNIQPPN